MLALAFALWLKGPRATDHYIDEVARLGFDIREASSGGVSIPTDDILRLVKRVQRAGPKAKPEVGIQFGAGGHHPGGARAGGHARRRLRDRPRPRCLDADRYMIVIESEGITEEVTTCRTGVVARIARELGLEKAMSEAADPEVFGWYVKNWGPEVGQPVRRPLADRAARVFAPRDLGHEEPVPGRNLSRELTMALDVRTKRIYEPADRADGYRVLIDHVWPRGVSRERAQLDEWARELAPSDELRKWFDHVPERFEEFRARYRGELFGHAELIDKLRDRAKKGRVTIVYAARDEEHNNAAVLAELVRDG